MGEGGSAGRRTGAGSAVWIAAAGAAVVVAMEFVVIGIAPDMARALDISLGRTTSFVGLFAAGSAVLGPVVALASRRLTSDRAMIAALLPFVACLLVPSLGGFWTIALLRVAQGATLPLFVSAAGDALSKLSGSDGAAIGRVYSGVIVGGLLGPPGGAFVAGLVGWQIAFAALGGLAASVAIAIHLRRPAYRTTPAPRQTPGAARAGTIAGAAAAHLSLTVLQFAAMFSVYPFLAGALEAAGVARRATVPWLLLFGVAGVAGNALAARWSAGSMRRPALVVALALAAVGAVFPYPARTSLPLVVLLLGWGAAHAAAFTVCQLRVTRAMPWDTRLAGTLNISAANLGIAAGSTLGGWVFAAAGLAAVGWTCLALAVSAATVASCLRYDAGPA